MKVAWNTRKVKERAHEEGEGRGFEICSQSANTRVVPISR